jgi:hypothetical protein
MGSTGIFHHVQQVLILHINHTAPISVLLFWHLLSEIKGMAMPIDAQNEEPGSMRRPNLVLQRLQPGQLTVAKYYLRYGYYKQGSQINDQMIEILFSS